MKRVGWLPAALVMFLATEGCAPKVGYVIENPFRITPKEFHATTNTIALARSSVFVELDDMESVRAEFDSLIEATVREAGFLVVSAGEFGEILERGIEPARGAVDFEHTARIRAVRQLVVEEVRSKFNADAVLFPTIEAVPVEVDSATKAAWLGTSECVKRAPIRLFGCGNYRWIVTLPGLSVFVTIQDMDGAVMFRNGGGIQLLATPNFGWRENFDLFFTGETTVNLNMVPRDKLFVDKERNIEAVKFALAPLVDVR